MLSADRSATSLMALTWTFAQREMKARFKGTLLGWLWSLLVPLATLGLYAIVFGLIFRAQVEPLGNGHAPIYPLWLFLGLVAFNFFGNGLLGGAASLWSMATVINKVKVPILGPIVGSVIAAGLQSLVELALCLAILAILLNVGWTWVLLPAWMALFFLFTVGTAAVIAVLAVYFRDAVHLLGVVLQFALFATPVMYPLTMVPSEIFDGAINLRDVMASLPLAQFVTVLRALVYDLQPGTIHQWLGLAVCAGGAVIIGALTVQRYKDDVAEHLQ